jgi:peptidyl-tRNA hydrolase, PTH1 family
VLVADAVPWLLVGLGNPGSAYAGHRHNLGFMTAERWVDRHGDAGSWRDKFNARTTTASTPWGRVVVLLPQTYMNRSGSSVGPAAGFFHVPPARIIVAHDEIDFAVGRVAIKRGGGHGGHNGLRDLITSLGSPEFTRIRLGVGRPTRGEVADWVLSDFSSIERATLVPEMIDRGEAAITAIVRDGVAAAMNALNTKT